MENDNPSIPLVEPINTKPYISEQVSSSQQQNQPDKKNTKLKKLIIVGIIGFIVVVGGLVILLSRIFTEGDFWLDEGDKGFEKASEVKALLAKTMPDKTYKLRYYKQSTDPQLINSLFVEYVDPKLDIKDTKKYVDSSNGKGEFVTLGDALCSNVALRRDLQYKVITFSVVSAPTGIQSYYENKIYCLQ